MKRPFAVNHPTSWLAGYIPDLPTHFDAEGAIDLDDAFQRLCERDFAAAS